MTYDSVACFIAMQILIQIDTEKRLSNKVICSILKDVKNVQNKNVRGKIFVSYQVG